MSYEPTSCVSVISLGLFDAVDLLCELIFKLTGCFFLLGILELCLAQYVNQLLLSEALQCCSD